MFFTLAKLCGPLLELPGAAVLAVVVSTAGLWTRFRRTSRAAVTLAALFLALCAIGPFAPSLLRPLEDRFPRPILDRPPTGAIVLGGVTDEAVTVARDAVALNDGAERLTEAVALARRFPTMRLVFTGGSGALRPDSLTEAAVARRFWTEMGVPAERMTFEDRARDTWQNATFTKELLSPNEDEAWLLVTSAAHMPRSIGIFRRIGFAVIPYPVDFHTTGGSSDFRNVGNAASNFAALAAASHEWIGLVAYYLAGKTDALFPGP